MLTQGLDQYGNTVPCYKCGQRTEECHATCPKYKRFKKVHQTEVEAEDKAKEADILLWKHDRREW